MRKLFRATVAASMAVLLAGCDLQNDSSSQGVLDSIIPRPDPAEQSAVVIKESLRSPDSFEYITGKVIWEGTYKGNSAFVTLVSYNAQNGFGALLRGCAIVAFSITSDDKVSWSSLYGMREADRAMCERSGDGEALSDVAKSFADLNFPSEKPSRTPIPDNAETSPVPRGEVDATVDEAAKAAGDAAEAAANAAEAAEDAASGL